jgi:hypothetical protein
VNEQPKVNMDVFSRQFADKLSSLTGRLHSNARSVLNRAPRDDDPAGVARQRYYGAYERYAVVRDILQLASLADWAQLLSALESEAEAKRIEARRVYDEQAALAVSQNAPAQAPATPRLIEVPLPFDETGQ